MTEFAAALNKQSRDEMGDMAPAMVGAERFVALEKRVAKLEAALTNPKMAPGALPAAPATNPDPTA
jgi:hypothetical protein